MLIVLCSFGFSLSYANEANFSSQDKISVEFKMVCEGAQSDCIKATMQNNYEEIFVSNNSFLSIEDIASAEVIVKKSEIPDSIKEAIKKSGGKIALKPEPMVVINLRFNEGGKRKISEITTKNVGKRIAIFIDGKLRIAPKIHEPTTAGEVSIVGNFAKEEAQSIADRINKTVTQKSVTIAPPLK